MILWAEENGRWVPAIPEPFYLGRWRVRARCECGRIFKTREQYRTHWRDEHRPDIELVRP